jgi:hypothetical protein
VLLVVLVVFDSGRDIGRRVGVGVGGRGGGVLCVVVVIPGGMVTQPGVSLPAQRVAEARASRLFLRVLVSVTNGMCACITTLAC